MNENELNQALLEACLSKPVNYSLVESLLQKGAQPLGMVCINGYQEIAYEDIVDNLFDNEKTPEDLYLITELFLRYGMDLSAPNMPGEAHKTIGEEILWFLAFFSNECVLRTIKLMLDYGLSADAAGACWGHAIFDLVDIDCMPLEDELEYEIYYDYIRKLMLFASYPHVLDNDEYLQKEIWLDYNQYDLMRFRNWDDFRYEISSPSGDAPEGVYQSVVTIICKETGDPVWRFGECLDAEEYPNLWLTNRSFVNGEE